MSWYSNDLRMSKRTVRICILVAIVLVGLGINELYSEQTGGFGRGVFGLIREILYTWFGAAGLCAFWVVLAMVPLRFARFIWRHTACAPNDRWYRN